MHKLDNKYWICVTDILKSTSKSTLNYCFLVLMQTRKDKNTCIPRVQNAYIHPSGQARINGTPTPNKKGPLNTTHPMLRAVKPISSVDTDFFVCLTSH